jgi:hypothetical protein
MQQQALRISRSKANSGRVERVLSLRHFENDQNDDNNGPDRKSVCSVERSAVGS